MTTPRPPAAMLAQAVHQKFQVPRGRNPATSSRAFQASRISLLIALAFLGASLTLGDLVGSIGENRFAAACNRTAPRRFDALAGRANQAIQQLVTADAPPA
jgi:hypothetical protein